MQSNLNTAHHLNAAAPVVPLTIDTDEHLIQRIDQRDAEALSALYDRYSTQVYSVAIYMTRSTVLAEEATQDAFMKIWMCVARYPDASDCFLTWLLTMTRQCVIDLLRREHHKTGRYPLTREADLSSSFGINAQQSESSNN